MSDQQLVFVFDQAKCVGCQACEINCKAALNVQPGVRYRKVISYAYTGTSTALRPHLSLSCVHCEDPVCIKACPAAAYSKREEDGVVIQDPEKCIGCQYCIRACPYNAPQFNEATRRTEKCNFCDQRLAAGLIPACVETCPTGALTYGELAEVTAQYPEYQSIPNLMDAHPHMVMLAGGALHPPGSGDLQAGLAGEIDRYFSTDTGIHWWLDGMRPAGKAVLGAAAVLVGASAIQAALSKEGKRNES